MRAIVQNRYGDAPEDVLRSDEAARPTIGPDEVLVQVHAASVDRGTGHVVAALPYPIRLAGFGLRRPKALNPGRAVAGAVIEVGEHVTGFRPGDEVYGIAEGGFAESARAKVGRLAAKPRNLSFAQAAAVPVSGLTALQAVRDHAKVQAGERVLVIGGSGGVGTFAVQLAKARGAHVTAVVSTGKIDLVRKLGADEVVDYTHEDITGRYDAILDIGGNRPLSRLRRALTPRGRLVIVRGETGGRGLGGTPPPPAAAAPDPAVRQPTPAVVLP